MRLFQLDEIEEIDPPALNPILPQKNILLASFENPAAMSPYRLNPSYRRPPGGDSDHGYSTMTPHEDSEHMGPTYNLESLLASKGKQCSPTPTQSITSCSRASSPAHLNKMPQKAFPQTMLPTTVISKVPEENSHVLAHVQVHMVDTR